MLRSLIFGVSLWLSSLALGTSAVSKSCSIIAHEGTPVGKEEVHNGIVMYVTEAKDRATDKAVLYLTDAFGLPLNENKLLADSFARAGFFTVMPDIFSGDPAPHDITFNSTEFLARHTPEVVDPIVNTTIDYLRNTVGVKTLAVTGYCFGGRYAFRFGGEARGTNVVFAAHPSLLEDDEVSGVNAPASIAAAEIDQLMLPERRLEIENLLGNSTQPFQVTLYSGTPHGFGTRGNISDPEQKFGKEQAFYQAVTWFENWG